MTSFGKSAVLPEMSDSPGSIYPILRPRFVLDYRNTSADSQLSIEDRNWSELLKPGIAPPEESVPDDTTQPMAQFLDSWGIYSDLITESGIFPLLDTLNPYLGTQESGEPTALLLPSHSIVRQNSNPGLAPPSANKGSSSQSISAEPSSHSSGINTEQMYLEIVSEGSSNKKIIESPRLGRMESAENKDIEASQPSNIHNFNLFQFPLNFQNVDPKTSAKPLQDHATSSEKKSDLSQNLSKKPNFEVQPFPLLPYPSPESSPEESSSLENKIQDDTELQRNIPLSQFELNSELTSPIQKLRFQKLSSIKHRQERTYSLVSNNEFLNKNVNSVADVEKEPLKLSSPDSAKANAIGSESQNLSSNNDGVFPTALMSKRYFVSPSAKAEAPDSISETPILSKNASKKKDHFNSFPQTLRTQKENKNSQNHVHFKHKKSTFLAKLQLKKGKLNQAVSKPITCNKSLSKSTRANPSKDEAKPGIKSPTDNSQKIKPRAIESKQLAERLKAVRFRQLQQHSTIDSQTQFVISENLEPIHPITRNRTFPFYSPQEKEKLTESSNPAFGKQEATNKPVFQEALKNHASPEKAVAQPTQLPLSLKSLLNPLAIPFIHPQTAAGNTGLRNLSDNSKAVSKGHEVFSKSVLPSRLKQIGLPQQEPLSQTTQSAFALKSLLEPQQIANTHSPAIATISELKNLSPLPSKAINTASSTELQLPLLSQGSLNPEIIRGHIFPRINPQASLKQKKLTDNVSTQDSDIETALLSGRKSVHFNLLSKPLTPTKKTLSLGIAFPLRLLSRKTSGYQAILPVKRKASKLKKNNIINSSKTLLPQKSDISYKNSNANSRLRTTIGALRIAPTPDAVNPINHRFYLQQSPSAAILFKRALMSNDFTFQKTTVLKSDKQNSYNLPKLNQLTASILQPSVAKKYRLQGWKDAQSFNSRLLGQPSENSMPAFLKNAAFRKQEEAARQHKHVKAQKLEGTISPSSQSTRIYPLALGEENLSLRRENDELVKDKQNFDFSFENNPLKANDSQGKREGQGNPRNAILNEGSYVPLLQSERGFRANNADLKANVHPNEKMNNFSLNGVENSHFGNVFKKNSESILRLEQDLSRSAISPAETPPMEKEKGNQLGSVFKRELDPILPIEQHQNRTPVRQNTALSQGEAKAFRNLDSVSPKNAKRRLTASKALVPSTIKRFQVQIPEALKRPETNIMKPSNTASLILPVQTLKQDQALPQFIDISTHEESQQRSIPIKTALSKKAISILKVQQSLKQPRSQTKIDKLPKEFLTHIQPLASLEKKNWQNPEIVTSSSLLNQDRSSLIAEKNQFENDPPTIRIHIGKVRIETRPVEIKAPKKAVRPKASLSLKTYLSQRKDDPL